MPEIPELSTKWSDYEHHFRRLESTDLAKANLQDWLSAWSDLQTKVRGVETRLRWAAYGDLGDEDAQLAYDEFNGKLLPKVEGFSNKLKEKFLSVADANEPRYQQMIKTFGAEIRVYSEDNAELTAEHKVLSEKFDRIFGRLKVAIDGKEVSFGETADLLVNKDRVVREKGWKARWEARLSQEKDFDKLYIALLKKRQNIAQNAGFGNYRDYRWLEWGRFDYEPNDCFIFAEAIQEEIVPLLKKVRGYRKKLLGLKKLRPWDSSVYPFETEILSPFTGVVDLKEKTRRVLEGLDAEMHSLFTELIEQSMLDISPRENKSLFEYADFDYITGLPVIFLNCFGRHSDIHALFHEFGHAFHYKSTMRNPLYWNQWGRMEVMEFSAQTLELLAIPFLDEYFEQNQVDMVRFLFFERILASLTFIPILDLFQHWVYTQDYATLTPAMLDRKYSELANQYSVGINWDNLDEQRAKGWYFSHIFREAFYYIEYGFAWIGALDVYGRYKEKPSQALSKFKDALALGKKTSISTIFRSAGSQFPIQKSDVKRAARLIEKELNL